MIWKRDGIANSKITIHFKITSDVESGYYRIVHTGKWKNGWTGKINPYSGTSKTFYVNGFSNRISKKEVKKNMFNQNIVFPNPTNGNFTFINNKKSSGSYKIINTIGQVIKSGEISDDRYHTNLSFKGESGVYLIKVEYTNGETDVSTILKK